MLREKEMYLKDVQLLRCPVVVKSSIRGLMVISLPFFLLNQYLALLIWEFHEASKVYGKLSCYAKRGFG